MDAPRCHSFSDRRHFFVGFHDASPMAPDSTRFLALAVDDIDRPPVAGDSAALCVVDWASGKATQVAETTAWNFPQGARQHFAEGGRSIVYNRREGEAWTAASHDLATGRTRLLEKPVYSIAPDGTTGYGLNFARLHRLGGYGYVGCPDPTAHCDIPADDGLWTIDLPTGRARLLVSVEAVCSVDGARLPRDTPHYLTHAEPSPDGRSLCFLHRYWLPDGGILTRLMVCTSDGRGLHCRAAGYLSHFDWQDDETIMIWGRPPSSVEKSRNHPLLRIPLLRFAVRLAKPAIKRVLGGKNANGSYMLIGARGFEGRSFAPGLLTEDGHPSFRPATRDWLLTDTYPDRGGLRRLMICPVAQPAIHELGRFRELRAAARTDRLDAATAGIDSRVLKSFKPATFAHTRSGIHCDLHPRWRPDGQAVCFDSNHEGARRVYTQDVSSLTAS